MRISSDPFIVPNLIKRFYRIPDDLIKWGGENLLEVRLYGKHAMGISEPVYIREASTGQQQRAVIDLDNERAYLSDLGNLTEVDLDAQAYIEKNEVPAGSFIQALIRLCNNSDHIAFFAGIKVRGIEDATTQIYSDNWFSVLPGSEKCVWVKLYNDKKITGSFKARFELTGWNIRKKNIGGEFKDIR